MKPLLRLWLSIMLICTLLLTVYVPQAAEAADIRLIINGVLIHPDVPPFLYNNRTLVPVRVIAEGLGGDVQWDQSLQRVTITRDQAVLVLHIGSSEVWFNDQKYYLDTAPLIRDARTMVPVRFISERLGCTVDWDDGTKTVYVDSSAVKLTEAAYLDGDRAGWVTLKTCEDAVFSRSTLNDEQTILVTMPGTACGLPVQSTTINRGGVRRITVRVSSDGSAQVQIDLLSGQLWQETVTDRTYTLELPRVVTAVEYMDRNGLDAVTVKMSGSLDTNSFTLQEPLRAVMDFTKAYLAGGAGTVEVESPFLERIRFAQHSSDVVRVVADLKTDIPYRIEEQDQEVQMIFPSQLRELVIADSDEGAVVTLRSDSGLVTLEPAGEQSLVWIVPEGVWSEQAVIRFEQEGEDTTVWTPEEVKAGVSVSGKALQFLQVLPKEAGSMEIRLDLKRSWQDMQVKQDSRFEAQLQIVLPPPPPLAGRVIVLDPGHGGSSPGAVGPLGTLEKTVNLAIALKLRNELTAQGAQVLMTRDGDETVSLLDRADLANQASADIFISIHGNGFYLDTANGTETFYYTDNHPDSALLAEYVHRETISQLELRDRGVKTANFTVLTETTMPSILVEVAFITNPAEELLLINPDFQQRAAIGMRQGVLAFFANCR